MKFHVQYGSNMVHNIGNLIGDDSQNLVFHMLLIENRIPIKKTIWALHWNIRWPWKNQHGIWQKRGNMWLGAWRASSRCQVTIGSTVSSSALSMLEVCFGTKAFLEGNFVESFFNWVIGQIWICPITWEINKIKTFI